MVFCDSCNICVHQACYGITNIPSGPWLCRTCHLGIKPKCELCPNKGGAMKSTRSGQKWAHVSCALWIPEVSIGCVDKMEPITRISSIPVSVHCKSPRRGRRQACQPETLTRLLALFEPLDCCCCHHIICQLPIRQFAAKPMEPSVCTVQRPCRLMHSVFSENLQGCIPCDLCV